jgi:glycosyltransferase involved in cell wall biosynthesis
VRDGKDGFVVAPGDVPALAAALRTLLIDPGLRERMGKSARHRAVEELSVDRFAESIFDLYREMSKA